jgi:hypothetical protein
MWPDYAAVGDNLPVGIVAEASQLFAELAPLEPERPSAGGSRPNLVRGGSMPARSSLIVGGGRVVDRERAPSARGRVTVHAALALLAIGAGCSRPASESRPGPAGEAAARQPADPARCAEYRELLGGLAHGPPAAFADEALLDARHDLPVEDHTRPVSEEDAELARGAIELGRDGAAHAARAIQGPRAYVWSERHRAGRADFEALRAAVPESVELRVLYARPKAEVVERFVAAFPRTPAALRDRLPLIDGFSTGADPLIAMAGSCSAALRALEPARRGADASELAPGLAEALDQCDCALADLDGFVALVAWLTAPMPRMGWLPIEDAR